MKETWCWCELDVVTLAILSLPYSHWLVVVASTGLKEEIAKFCVMDDAFVTSVLWTIVFALIRSVSSL